MGSLVPACEQKHPRPLQYILISAIQSAKFTRAGDTKTMAKDKIHFTGRYLGMRERGTWEFATRTNASAVAVLVPVTDNDELVLVEQYRVPVEGNVIELPAGLVGDKDDENESVLTAAQRELEEETGFRSNRLTLLLTCPSSPGMSDETISIYLAEDLVQTGPGGGDESEAITVHIIPIDTVTEWLAAQMKAGKLVDPKTYAALFWLERRSKGLSPVS